MKNPLIGRQDEQKILQKAFASESAEMVAVIGRRRVGKTFLIKTFFKEHITFEITGLQKANQQTQINHFHFALIQQSDDQNQIAPKNWLEAFQRLVLYLDKKSKNERQVVFFDELPWLAGNRQSFLTALGFFWNSWAVNNNVVVVICGSAASWMIENVVNNTGGLYNRITKRIFLQAFNLSETNAFLNSRNINFNHQQIAELYMAMGGIPHYLKEVEADKCVMQNIDAICFAKSGLLQNEFSQLYPSLFNNADRHISIIRALEKKQIGLSRSELIKKSGLSEGGNSTKVLEELEQSGFISSYFPFGKKSKGKLFRLTDEYSLFYLRFIEHKRNEGIGTWQHFSQTQAYKIWCGYAFENLCLKHLSQIKKALGISGIYSKSASFYKKGTNAEKGTQIDLIIDRNDKVVNLFEIKFHNTKVSLSASQANEIREKMRIFQETTKTSKYILMTIITALGLKSNKHSLGLIQKEIELQDVFEEG